MGRIPLLYVIPPLIGAVIGVYALAPSSFTGATAPTAAMATATAEPSAAAEPTGKAAPFDAQVVNPVPVMVLPSTAQQTAGKLILRGRTAASRNVLVPAETSGLVISEPLRRGARVEEGQLLCRLAPGVRAAQLAEAQAALNEARTESQAAEQLQKKGFAAETTMNTRMAQLQAAQARLDQVSWDISKLEIRSPFSGVLETDTAEIGSLLTPGSHCANVIDLSLVKVTAFVAEQEVDLIAIGQPAHATLLNGTEVTGEISFISRVADEKTRTYAVDVTMANPEGRIRDGMTAELEIELPARTAHLIPQTALTLDDDGRIGVRIDEDGIARFKPVRILRDAVDGAWVSGLPDVVAIIVVGQEFVRDGRTIAASLVSLDDLR